MDEVTQEEEEEATFHETEAEAQMAVVLNQEVLVLVHEAEEETNLFFFPSILFHSLYILVIIYRDFSMIIHFNFRNLNYDFYRI